MAPRLCESRDPFSIHLHAWISLPAFNAVVSLRSGVALGSHGPDRPRGAGLALEHHDLIGGDAQAVDPLHQFQPRPGVTRGTEVTLQTRRAGVPFRTRWTLSTIETNVIM